MWGGEQSCVVRDRVCTVTDNRTSFEALGIFWNGLKSISDLPMFGSVRLNHLFVWKPAVSAHFKIYSSTVLARLKVGTTLQGSE